MILCMSIFTSKITKIFLFKLSYKTSCFSTFSRRNGLFFLKTEALRSQRVENCCKTMCLPYFILFIYKTKKRKCFLLIYYYIKGIFIRSIYFNILYIMYKFYKYISNELYTYRKRCRFGVNS